MSKRHSISIQSNIYTRLIQHGQFGESFSDLLNRLLNDVEGKKSGSVNLGEDYQNQGEASSIDR
jgi:predicted CopG family antitoxin